MNITNQTHSYSRIKGLSQVRRLPRLGKVRLGIKVKKARADSRCKHNAGAICHFCSFPKEVSYFVCPPEVQRIYGREPVELDVMLPIENEEVCFPQSLKWYVSSHLKCKGNGETAMRRVADLSEEQKAAMNGDLPKDENDLVEIPCPCPLLDSGECSQVGNLMLLLPKVSMSGVYQIDSGSYNNIVRINSAIDYIRALIGRVALVPLKLKRIPESIEYQGKKAIHYLLSLEFDGNLDAVKTLRNDARAISLGSGPIALPEPVESGPEPTGDAPVEVEETPANPETVTTEKQTQPPAPEPGLPGVDDVIGKAGEDDLKDILKGSSKTMGMLTMYVHRTFKVNQLSDLKFSDYESVVRWINGVA